MNKAIKRIITALLAVTLCFSLVGCSSGKSEDTSSKDTSGEVKSDDTSADTSNDEENSSSTGTGEVTTVKVCLPTAYDSTDAGLIEAAINEIIGDKYGLNMELTMVNMGSWAEQSNLLMTGNEVDVIAIFSTPLTTYVNNGQFLHQYPDQSGYQSFLS